MTISEAIYSKLSNDSGVSAQVSTRIYPSVAAQDSDKPYIVFYRISTERIGALNDDTDVVNVRFQIDVWASSYTSLRTTADAVRSALQRWQNVTVSSTKIEDSVIEDEQESYDNDVKAHRAMIDVIITHRE